MTDPQTKSLLIADAGLRCPKCDYNLTGLAEDRCPECGEAFNREQLRMLAEGKPGPIPGWDNVSDPIRAFIGTCLRTWFAPVTLGRTFPAVHDRHSLSAFKLAAFCVTVCEGLFVYFGLVGKSPYRDVWVMLPLIISVFLGLMCCERWARGVLELCFGRCIGSDRNVDVWAGLAGLHRSFLLISAVVIPISSTIPPGDMLVLASSALVLWWSTSLTIAAVSRGHSWVRAVPAVFLLWISAVAAAFVGAFGGFMIGGLIIQAIINAR
jgi:hypothetical protein